MKKIIFNITFLICSLDLFSQSHKPISKVDLNKYVGVYVPFQAKDTTLNKFVIEISKKNDDYYIGFFQKREIDRETKEIIFLKENQFKIANSELTLEFSMINDSITSFVMKNLIFRKNEINELKFAKTIK